MAFLFAMGLTAATAYLVFQKGFYGVAAWAPVMAVVSLFVLAMGFAVSLTVYTTYGEVCATTTYTSAGGGVENVTTVCKPAKVIYDPRGFGLVAAIVGLAHLILYGAFTAFYPIARRRLWS